MGVARGAAFIGGGYPPPSSLTREISILWCSYHAIRETLGPILSPPIPLTGIGRGNGRLVQLGVETHRKEAVPWEANENRIWVEMAFSGHWPCLTGENHIVNLALGVGQIF